MSHPVVHFEITGKDQAKLSSFYSSLFGWKMGEIPGMNYTMVEADGSGIGGGIGASQDGGPGYVTFYVQADDPQAVLDHATSLGGRVIMPVTELPQVTIALFADPEGHIIGVAKGM